MIDNARTDGAGTLVLTPALPPLPTPLLRRPETYGVAAAAGILLLLAYAAFVRIRGYLNRPPSPETLALAALERDGSPLGVSRALRDYVAARFPALETSLGATEFEARAAALPEAGWLDIVRECDAANFGGVPVRDNLAGRARALVETHGRRVAAAKGGRA